MGNHFPKAAMLAEFSTLGATVFAASATFPMLGLYALSIGTVIVIMVNVSVRGRVFKRVCIVGITGRRRWNFLSYR